MSSCRLASVLLVLLVPVAAAHLAPYDPLVLDLHGQLTADGRIVLSDAAPGSVPFPASAPGAEPPPLRFVLASPVRFTPGGAFDVTLQLRADSLVVARDAEGNALEVTVEPGGAPQRVALDPAVLAPGTTATARVQVQAGGASYEEGQEIVLLVRALMPLAENAFSIMVGGASPSRFEAPDMRVPRPADLRMQDVPHTEFLLEGESFEPPPSHAVNTFVVTHDAIVRPSGGAWSVNGTYVVLRGEEADETARAHAQADRAARIAAAHELRVNGVTARVHPGLAVVVRVHQTPIVVECARNCPADFRWTLEPPTRPPGEEPPSALVPPPRDTRGIPASEDEPADRGTPLAPLLALVALAFAAGTKR